MTTYQDVWDSMNELDMTTSKLGYIKQMLEFIQEEIDNRDHSKAETMMFVLGDYVQNYLDDYDTKFQRAWAHCIQAGKELDDVRAKLSRLENPNNPQYTDEELQAMTIKEMLS